jgi:cytochrome c553
MSMRRSALMMIAPAMLAGSAFAASPAPDGRQIVERGSPGGAQPCIACHGIQLEGSMEGGGPELAGHPAADILQKLKAYAGPTGQNEDMRKVAAALSPAEAKAAADYIASLPAGQ